MPDLTFTQWLRGFDAYVIERTGLSFRDFADFPSRDCYDGEASYEEAFETLLDYQDEDASELMELFS